MRDTITQTLLNLAAAASTGTTMLVQDFRNVVFAFDTDGGADANLTVKFQGSISADAPDFSAARSASNQWDYINVIDLEDGSSIDGDVGLSVAGADDNRQVEANINGLKWISATVTARSAGDVSENKLLTTEQSSLDGFTFGRRKGEGDDYFQENPAQNYSKTMTKYRVGLLATITWEMRTYDKYREMRLVLSNLGMAVAQRMELDLTHRFTFGLATTYVDLDGVTVPITVGDGLALFSAVHTVTESSTTFRNIVANNPAFSKGGLEAAETLFTSQMIDSQGTKIVVKPDTIITTDDPVVTNAVRQFIRSTADPTQNNPGVTNEYKGKYRHIELPYLATDNLGGYNSAKKDYWMLAAVQHTDAVLEISEMPHMIAPSPGANSEDFDNDDWKFKGSAAYGIEIIDPKWLVFTDGLGTA